jgi:hypothetical protein
VGIIIGIGNTGHHLHSRADESNVMMSRDSGLSWTQVALGSHIYEVADHGGLIVLANDRIATNQLLFSWNEGGNWTGFKFWKHHMEVENVITEPRGASQEFIVYGRRKEKGVVVHVDFSTVHKRRCEGAESPGASDSDFETYALPECQVHAFGFKCFRCAGTRRLRPCWARASAFWVRRSRIRAARPPAPATTATSSSAVAASRYVNAKRRISSAILASKSKALLAKMSPSLQLVIGV